MSAPREDIPWILPVLSVLSFIAAVVMLMVWGLT